MNDEEGREAGKGMVGQEGDGRMMVSVVLPEILHTRSSQRNREEINSRIIVVE